MFAKQIEHTTFNSAIADRLFSYIAASNYEYDASFEATLRALLGRRILDDQYIGVNRYDIPEMDRTEVDIIDNYTNKYMSNGIDILCFKSPENTANKLLDEVGTRIISSYDGYRELDDIRFFTEKQMEARFFICEDRQNTIILINQLNIRIWHFIQSFISRLVPWYFKDEPLDDEEKKLVVSLTNKNSTEYEQLIELFVPRYDFRTKQIQYLLDGFEKKVKVKQLEEVRYTLERQNQALRNNIAQYRDMVGAIDNLKVRESGLVYQINEVSDESQLIEYLLCNKNIDPIYATGTELHILVKCHIDNFDPDLYERMTENERSYLFIGYAVGADAFLDRMARKKLLDAIFSDNPTLRLKMCAFFCLDIGGYVSTTSNYNFPGSYTDYLPNPHYHFYACIGNNTTHIESCLRNRDLVGAIEQCATAATNINLAEGSQTVAPFMEMLFSSSCTKVIMLPDGTSCTPTEAYEYLTKNEEE